MSFWTWKGWPALVAIGTLSLAGVTLFLVLVTKRLAAQGDGEVRALSRPVLLVHEQVDIPAMTLGTSGPPTATRVRKAGISYFDIGQLTIHARNDAWPRSGFASFPRASCAPVA